MAINPATPLYALEEVLDYIDGINLQMVNPGFAGQKVARSTLKKVAKPKGLLKKQGYEEIIIEVDGNISPENGRKLRECRASIFVGGTSSIFKGSVSNL